jgi:hypothetical protein
MAGFSEYTSYDGVGLAELRLCRLPPMANITGEPAMSGTLHAERRQPAHRCAFHRAVRR